jgi:hypothetical protein
MNTRHENAQLVSTVEKTKCKCVPSGMCHSHTLLGCPHEHYFNDTNKWTCGKNVGAQAMLLGDHHFNYLNMWTPKCMTTT